MSELTANKNLSVKEIGKKMFNKTTAQKGIATALLTMLIQGMEQTFCVDLSATLNKTTDLIFTLLNWGGIIISVVGVVMIGKAIMNASSGQAQPGEVGKALGIIVLGVLMLAAKSVLTLLGVQATI